MFFAILIAFFKNHACSTQTLLFATIIIGLWVIELAITEQPWKHKWRHTSVNAMFILTALPIQLFMTVFMVAIASWATANHWGLIHFVPGHRNIIFKYTVLFFMMDFFEYVYHRCMHRVRPFWLFHLVHHCDRKLDVSTTLREHPGETFIRNGFMLLWVFICGAPFGVLLLRQAVQTVADIFAHTSIELNPRLERTLGWLFITPSLHRVHHHYQLPYTDSNYGDVFSVWDRLFGTYRELGKEAVIAGLDTHMNEGLDLNFWTIAGLPFRERDDKTESARDDYVRT